MSRAIIAVEDNGDPSKKLLWHSTNVTETILLFSGGFYFEDKSTKSV